ncbi:MAG: PAS domain S-box protein [Algoriphagus aquaeductus]|uniref:PAS domain S-box protein n=1 Tax=Algoriphagus aquaeductus TaxID=475299 RepID=UPI00387A0B20
MKKDSFPYKALVIEDNFGDYFLIEEYLSEHIQSPDLVHASTFLAAKEFLSTEEGNFDVILLDLSLPDHSGEKLIIDIIKLAKRIPVIALTGFTDLDFSIKSLALGVSDYLLKDDLTPAMLYKTIIYSIERKKFVDELQKSERKYSNLFHLSPLPMCVCDSESLQILDVNDSAVKHYGFTEEEFLNKNFKDLFSDFSYSENQQLFHNSNLHQKPTKGSHTKKNGELIEVEMESSQIVFNEIDASLILINDVTEKNLHLATIEKQNAAFREIAWIRSHVVRAPLARLMGLVNLLGNDAKTEDEDAQTILQYIKTSAEELDQIIRDISKKSEEITRPSD